MLIESLTHCLNFLTIGSLLQTDAATKDDIKQVQASLNKASRLAGSSTEHAKDSRALVSFIDASSAPEHSSPAHLPLLDVAGHIGAGKR